ncbi:MAG: Hpt domain-containing protein [Caulobacteraceae bacterium]|nr:Hpt domain-containing protein [Caulobacteraceae bacterium]
MSKPSGAQFIQPPNTLRLKVGGSRFGGIDPAALAKAEAALANLSSQFEEWLADEMRKLDGARAEIQAHGYTVATAETLYLRAHDMKGLGGTYGYPLITRVAASLCKLTDEEAVRMKAPLFLIDAHIDAIKAIIRDQIKDEAHPVGTALAGELERKVAAHLASL